MIKILIAEHDTTDLEIIHNELLRGGLKYISEDVKTEEEYIHAIENFIPDIIFSDYTFPSFSGVLAFKIKEKLSPATPFILISGTIGEENSIELIKNGVTDFVLKDKIFTLNTRLARALKEANVRKQRNKAEKKLAQSETHLAEAQKLAKMGSWEFDIETGRLTWSKELYHVFDVDNKKFSKTFSSFVNLVDEEDRALVQEASRHTQLTGNPFTIEYHITTATGEKRIIREQGYGKKDDTGKVVCSFGTAQDITADKKAEEAIKKVYDEKINILESIDDGFFRINNDSLITYWNRRAEMMLGEKREDLIGKNLHEVFGATGSEVFYINYQKAIKEKITIYFEAFSNRCHKWLSVSAYGSENGLSVYFKDITEQKNAREKIKESELRYRLLIEQATDTICIWDATGKCIEVNPAGCSMFGYAREEMLQLFMTDVLFQEDLKTNPIRIEELKAGKTTHNERRIKRKDGTAVEVELSSKMNEDGSVVVFGRGISERKASEKLIIESEAKYRAFFDSSMDGILLTVTDGAILSANPAACEIFKMTEAEICAAGRMGVVDLTDPRLHILIEERQRTGRAKGELTLLRKDGSKFEAELTSAVFTDAYDRKRTSMIVRDISQRKAAELNLIQTTRELQHTLNDLNKIMDSSMDIICTVDDAGNFVQVSAAAQAIWGYSPQELININYINLLYPDDLEKSTAKNTEIKNGVSITMFENRFVHKNGSIVPMLWSANWDEHDQLMYCVGKDATEKKRLEKINEIERQRFLSLYLQAPSSMGILKGPNHEFEMANPPYLQLIGKSNIIGKTVKEAFPELESQGLLELLDTVYKTGNTFSANEMLLKHDRNGDGELVDVYLNFMYQAHRNHDGDIDGIVFFAIDVTEQVLSRRTIEASEKRYRQIVETAQEGIWMIDENHKTTFVNRKMCEILEYTEAEMMGKEIYFFMDEEGKQIAAEFRKKNKLGHTGQYIKKYISKAGKEIWTNVSVNPLFNEEGIYKGSLAMVTDINERKKVEVNLRESEKKYRQIVETAQEGIWLIDEDNKTTFVNRKMCEILEYTEDEMMGIELYYFMNAEGKKIAADLMEKKKDGHYSQAHFKYISKSGKEVWTHLSANPLFDEKGKYKGSLAMVTDITEAKKAEIQLNELNAYLQVQAKALTKSNTDLEQFAYVASHDLQEPLRMITSFITLLQKKYRAVMDDKGKQYMDFVIDGAIRMRQIILDLLEFSRVGRAAEMQEDIDLNMLIDEIQRLFRKQIEEKKAVIISHKLPLVPGYKSPMQQVFQNLISNALKYAAIDRAMRIDITCTEQPDHWQFAIHDNGIGIDQEYFDKIFVIFQRLHNKDEYSGTGMGLAITKKIIENMGGSIWVESTPGIGSTFYFTIPKITVI